MFSSIESGKKEKNEMVAYFQFLASLDSNGMFFIHEFDIRASQLHARHIYSENPNPGDTIPSIQPTRCNVIQYSLLLSMLCMFQAVSPPVIMSSKLYMRYLVYVKRTSYK
jgi:hypothetical protein